MCRRDSSSPNRVKKKKKKKKKTQAKDKDGRDSVEMLEAMQPPKYTPVAGLSQTHSPCRFVACSEKSRGMGYVLCCAQDASMGTTAHA